MKKMLLALALVVFLSASAVFAQVDLSDPTMVALNGAAEPLGWGSITLSHDESNSRASLFTRNTWAINRSIVVEGAVSLVKSTTTTFTADGTALCISAGGADALGALGRGMGFYGINAVCVGLKNYKNTRQGPSQASLLGIYLPGQLPAEDGSDAVALENVNLNDNLPKYIAVGYDYPTKELRVVVAYVHGNRPCDVVSRTVDLERVLGQREARVGATAGTATFRQVASWHSLDVTYW